MVGGAHKKLVFNRRIHKIVDAILPFFIDGEVLDVGCGNGELGKLLTTKNPHLHIRGIDVLERESVLIPYSSFDGETIPFPDNSFDYVMLIDVLHHLDNPSLLLSECARVSKKRIIVKDHFCENVIEKILLQLMDWAGNAQYGVYLPYNYFSREEWSEILRENGLVEVAMKNEIQEMYPFFIQFFMGRKIQFVSLVTTQIE